MTPVDATPRAALGGVTAARGFRAGATTAGIKTGPPRLDLAVVCADAPCTAHAVFTQCRVVAAPVVVSRARIAAGRAQGIVLNSGNANACAGPESIDHAREMADLTARHLGIDPELMLVASTGVIGVPLPMDRIRAAVPHLRPTRDGGGDAARAILTTDLVPKEWALTIDLDGRQVTVGGMAKGSGMIHPNLATMLAVITTDAPLELPFARSALLAAADRSFNQISVDADTSTNDMVVLFASGAAGGEPIASDSPAAPAFAESLERVCIELARAIARDGEGATRLIEVIVEAARSEGDARRAARAVVSSNLVKAAVHGCDPNWGRIIAAVGNAGIPIDPDAIDIFIGGHQVAQCGGPVSIDRAAVADAMGGDEVVIRVRLNQGTASGRAWGCDLSEGYVRINAEYTT